MDDEIELQALAWHDQLREHPSDATRQAFEAWRTADPRHAEAFAQQGRLTTEILGGGWRGVMPQPRTKLRARWFVYSVAGIAATAVALILLIPHGRPIVTPTVTIATAMPALTQARRLADGSLVILAAGAEVVSDGGDTRAARLVHGAARFIVLHDPAHPYRVTADGTTITARGTVFDVALTPNGARVALIEGRIDVTRAASLPAGPARVVVLRPGQSLDAGAGEPASSAGATAPSITWVEVDGMTLGDLLTIAARGNGATIRLADSALARLRVTGRFDMSRPAALAAKLAAALDLRVTRNTDGLVLDRPK